MAASSTASFDKQDTKYQSPPPSPSFAMKKITNAYLNINPLQFKREVS